MSHNLLLLQDQQSEKSFDSSEFCSVGSRTASIDSNISNQGFQAILMTPKIKTRSIDETVTEKTASIQKPRIQNLSQKHIFKQQDQFQIGFVMGRNKKNVAFNESKIKKARNFFDQQEMTFNDNSFQTHSLFQFPKKEQSRLLSQDSTPNQLSNPCFQNFGKKQKVQIDQSFLQKAKNFFNDDIEETNIAIPSLKKPTKVKKPFQQTPTQENYIKTVNVNKNKKKLEVNKIPKKQIFDWDRFLISSKKLTSSSQKSAKKQTNKKSSNMKNKQKSKSKYTFQTIKLQDLSFQQLKNQQKMQDFLNSKQSLISLNFFHEKNSCNIIKCLLCDIGIEQIRIDQKKLENIFSNKLIQEKFDSQIFAKLHQQICFKLQKYNIFYPMIINKRLNPSNILVEIHKKSKLIQTGNPFLGWLDFCLKENKFYHSFIAEVKQIYHNQKIKTFFFKLSDGWQNVWAVVTQKNYLYQFAHKVKICSKMFIEVWKNYALGNILSFCPLSKEKQKCIEIWYNSTILVKENIKLGKPGNLIFYRPLNKNRKQGGLIPTIQGTIIRMFCSYSQSKKKSFYNGSDHTFNDNYVEIITPQGYCVLIKLILPSERSLAELFRLYYRYHFYFLKIGSKDSILQFNDGVSKFFEFQKKDKKQYENQLVSLMKKRYINSMKDIKIQKILKVGQLYDIYIQGNKNIVNGLKFLIDENNENETTTNSYLKGGTYLYQQYQLDKLDAIKNSNHDSYRLSTFILKKTKFSNTLKALPAIYKQFNQVNDD